jgi:hypothetical protein
VAKQKMTLKEFAKQRGPISSPSGKATSSHTAGDDEPEQTTHPDLEAENSPEPQVRGNKVLVNFVRCRPDADEEGERFIHMEMAATLAKETVEVLPDFLGDAFHSLIKGHLTKVELDSETVLYARLFIASDHDACAIAASVVLERVRLQTVEEKGSTKSRQVIRLAFSLPIPQTDQVAVWACNNHGNLMWLELEEANRKLPLNRTASA